MVKLVKILADILECGFITYSNLSKNTSYKSQESLQMKGAVSREVSIEMAIGALKHSQTQVSISITGLSGSDRKI